MTRRSLIPILAALVLPQAVEAEFWPPLEHYVDECVLIVLCRTESFKDGFRYKIEETWKGVYSPELFYHEPDDGYLHSGAWHGNEGQREGNRTVFFFIASNHPAWAKGRLVDHSTSFQIKHDKLTYASTGGRGVSKDYALSEFRKTILQRVRRTFAGDLRQQIQGKR